MFQAKWLRAEPTHRSCDGDLISHKPTLNGGLLITIEPLFSDDGPEFISQHDLINLSGDPYNV